MKAVYLAHSAHEKERGLVFQKRIEALGISVFNPFTEVEQKGQNRNKIFEIEMEAIRKLDGLVAVLSEEFPQWGTPQEVFWASYILRMPVFLLDPVREGHKKHPFIKALVESYDNEDDLFRALEAWRDEE